MDSEAFERYTQQLLSSLESTKGVLGLVTLGTTADLTLRDEFSDHDFWLITETGLQDSFVKDLTWLPSPSDIALVVSHGYNRRTVLYNNRHKVEFAVFDVDEARQGVIERYAVLIDRANIASLIETVRLETFQRVAQAQTKPDALQGLCETLWSACERFSRGELLSARQYVDEFAVNKYLVLQSSAEEGLNGLEPRRRLESKRPELAAELLELSKQRVPQAALSLLDIAERELSRKRPELDWDGVRLVRTWIQELVQ